MMHGEAASAPLQDLNAMCENLCQTLKNYSSEDILIMMKQIFFGKCVLIVQYLMIQLLVQNNQKNV